MRITCVWEHNGNDTIMYSNNYIGAFTRGKTKEIALAKMQQNSKMKDLEFDLLFPTKEKVNGRI
ncbi:MAG TPA: hypothetical protein DHW61_03645 [Lachnoclostridium phytofermentans]|uniref:Uncharacterized protein n=1 Tax=Lachnoclostridium phytofermentans TaxID=66219 RepID=A0A3D2X2Y5_9FIRM|nr:hypothetical protein [Lachnoclostridium sp.]HCL01500.1 hypothetical protein [Lachnoclostridium phytofermentans]